MKPNLQNFNKLRQNLTNLFEEKKEIVSPNDCIAELPQFSSSTQLGVTLNEESKDKIIKSIKHTNFEVRNHHFEL